MEYALLNLILEFVYNGLPAQIDFKKEAQKIVVEDVEKVLKIECQITLN